MVKYMTRISALELLDAWRSAGHIQDAERERLEYFILAQQQEKELPLYLRVLVGIGAFIASLCFIGFLKVAGIIDFDGFGGERVLWGLAFIGAALFLVKKAGSSANAVKHSFLIQASFCAMGIGKILFVTGFMAFFEERSDYGITLATVLVTALTYHAYRMSIDRFLSALAVFTSLLINSVTEYQGGMLTEVALNALFLGELALAAFLFTHTRIRRDYIPLAYAAACSLCMIVLYVAAESSLEGQRNGRLYSLTFITVLLMVALMGVICWAAGSIKRVANQPIMLAMLGAVLLGGISVPGVIAALCLMVLGYAKHEALLMLIGVMLMPVFIGLYYYNLDISLMAKSGVLIGSGGVLLAGWAYLSIKGLDKEV